MSRMQTLTPERWPRSWIELLAVICITLRNIVDQLQHTLADGLDGDTAALQAQMATIRLITTLPPVWI